MMTQRTAIILGAMLLAGVAAGAWFWDYQVEETRRAMLATAHECPSGTSERIERSGEIGLVRLCIRDGVRHGPFAYWKNTRKQIEGSYVDGKLAGRQVHYGADGRVARIEEHPAGNRATTNATPREEKK